MKTETKTKLFIGVSIVMIVGITLLGPNLKEYWGTRYANADREIFENSKPFVHGQIENLQRLRLEYMTADDNHKSAIRLMVVSQTANLDKSRLPQDLQNWIKTL